MKHGAEGDFDTAPVSSNQVAKNKFLLITPVKIHRFVTTEIFSVRQNSTVSYEKLDIIGSINLSVVKKILSHSTRKRKEEKKSKTIAAVATDGNVQIVF